MVSSSSEQNLKSSTTVFAENFEFYSQNLERSSSSGDTAKTSNVAISSVWSPNADKIVPSPFVQIAESSSTKSCSTSNASPNKSSRTAVEQGSLVPKLESQIAESSAAEVMGSSLNSGLVISDVRSTKEPAKVTSSNPSKGKSLKRKLDESDEKTSKKLKRNEIKDESAIISANLKLYYESLYMD